VAKVGTRMTSVESGETFVFLQTEENGSRVLVIDMICEPGGGAKGAPMPMHFHPTQEERFYIQQGVMEYVLNGVKGQLRAGESIVIPAGTLHTWRNPSADEKLLFLFEFEPVSGVEYVFENMTALSQMGKLRADGRVPLLACFRTLHHYSGNLYLVGLPVWMQKLGIAAGAFIAWLLGYPVYHKYEDALSARAQLNKTEPITSMDERLLL
jgi:quercetin dioxygenase-like cupin family protein